MSTGVFRRRFLPPPPSHPQALGAFAQPDTLAADYGTLTLSGGSAILAVYLSAGYGTLTLSGQDATVLLTQSADYGTLTLTGYDAGLSVATLMDAEKGDLTLTGQDATFSFTVVVESGTLTLTGSNIPLTFASDPGTLTLQPRDANFYIDLAADKGDLTLTGEDLNAQFVAVFDAGTLTLTGGNTNFEIGTPRGGGKLKKRVERKEVRLRHRTIEIEKDGKKKKVDYVDRFAPPPPPPPLELIPDWLFPDVPPQPAAQPQPIETPLLGYSDPLNILAEVQAAEDERDAMAIIEQIGDPALDELNDFLAKLAA